MNPEPANPQGAAGAGPRRRWPALAAVCAITAAGAALRLYDLGRLSLMMDSVWILNIVQSAVPPTKIMLQWLSPEVGGAPSTIPFTVAFAAWFLQTFHLPVTIANLILPFALWGAATVPVAYLLGREMLGTRGGVLLGLMVAFSPLLVQMSREAYFYAPMVCGAFLLTWSLLRCLRACGSGAPLPWHFFPANAAGVFITAYASPSAWSYVALAGAIECGALAWCAFRRRRGYAQLAGVVLTFLLLGLPLLFVDWGLRNLLSFTSGEAKEYWLKVSRFSRSTAYLKDLWLVTRQYLWGTTLPRTLLSVAALLLAAAAIARGARRGGDRRWLALAAALALILGGNILSLSKSVWNLTPRYVAMLVPAFLLPVCGGLLLAVEATAAGLRRTGWRRTAAAYLVLALPLGLWLHAALLSTRIRGQPNVYADIVAWLDANMPERTPVITDRFFTAYNEYRAHPPTNVVFLSACPNQLREEYIANRFRERAEEIMRNNPVSAYHDERLHNADPAVGRWDFPDRFYARKLRFEDTVNARLSLIGQSLRGGGARDVLYNLPADVVRRAREEGAPGVALFDSGWEILQQGAPEFRVWRELGERATVHLYNLGEEPRAFALELTGGAVYGDKRVTDGAGRTVLCRANQLARLRFGPLELPRGRTVLTLTDPEWKPDLPTLYGAAERARQPRLVVASLRLVPADAAADAPAAAPPGP